MSGKAYTMREMKDIVHYLTEHKAYGDIKGRKMWKDFADSNLTNRTWQSLKETFLKRILPDIHNPYFKLSLQQISSFKQGKKMAIQGRTKDDHRSSPIYLDRIGQALKEGSLESPELMYDIESKLNRKLEVREVTDKSNVDKTKDPEYHTKTNMHEEKILDENKHSNVLSHHKKNTEDPSKSNLTNEKKIDSEVIDDSKVTSSHKKGTEDPSKTNIMHEESHSAKISAQSEVESDPKDLNKINMHDDKISSHRDSVDTLILENVEEEMQIDSLNPDREKSVLTLRQYIEYEPGTPVIKDIIDDFDDDLSSDRELCMDIYEDVDQNKDDTTNLPIEMLYTEDQQMNKNNDIETNTNIESEQGLHTSKFSDANLENPTLTVNAPNNNNKELNNITVVITNNSDIQAKKLETNSSEMGQSNTTTDTPLPNNQEHFNKNHTEQHNSSKQSSNYQKLSLKKKGNTNIDSTEIQSIDGKEKEPEDSALSTKYTKSNINNINNSNLTYPSLPNESEHITHLNEDNDKTYKNTENPCLKSANLYQAQMPSTKNSCDEKINNSSLKLIKDKEQRMEINNKNEEIKKNIGISSTSHSEFTANEVPRKKPQSFKNKYEKDKSLVNAFGFASGAGSSGDRRRKFNYRKTASRYNTIELSSESSDRSSEPASEYVSPPRARKNRNTRKYLKPKPARIFSLEDEGGLFVVYRKKIFPIVRDGGVVKSFATFSPDEASDEDRSQWKSKYYEEKKKNAELLRLIQQKQTEMETNVTEEAKHVPNYTNTIGERPKIQVNLSKEPTKNDEISADQTEDKKTLKIKMTENNKEIQVEGHWSLHPVLAKMVQLLHTEQEPQRNTKSCSKGSDGHSFVTSSSLPSPLSSVFVCDKVAETVDQLESEIFKEIEERDKTETDVPVHSQDNVTVRNVRTRKTPSPSLNSDTPAKRIKMDPVTSNKQKAIELKDYSPRRRSKKSVPTVLNDVDLTSMRSRRSLSRKSNSVAPNPDNEKEEEFNEETDILYKFPSPHPSHSKRAKRNVKKQETEVLNRYMSSEYTYKKMPVPRQQQEVFIKNGNKSSDAFNSKDTRNYSGNINSGIEDYLTDDLSETSNSHQENLMSPVAFGNTIINVEIDTSDSCQITLQKKQNLQDENKFDGENFRNDVDSKKDKESDKFHEHIEEVYDDIPSPILPVVKNFTVNKTLLNSANECPISDGTDEPIIESDLIMLNNFLYSEGDISMPIMKQDCVIEESLRDGIEYHYNLNMNANETDATEPFINSNPKFPHSINKELPNLNVEINKQPTSTQKKINLIKFQKNKVNQNNRTKTYERRSTSPRNELRSTRKKLNNTENAFEDEHNIECGRRSCPPIIKTSDVPPDQSNVNTIGVKGHEGYSRRKKDIFGGKRKNAKKYSSTSDTNVAQIGNDSKSVVFFQELNDSVDLIHNHSETCLETHDCVADRINESITESIRIDESSMSILSETCNSEHGDSEVKSIGDIISKHFQEHSDSSNAR